jgi:hypothetical protein
MEEYIVIRTGKFSITSQKLLLKKLLYFLNLDE